MEGNKLTILPYYRDAEDLYNNLSDGAMDELLSLCAVSGINPLTAIKKQVEDSKGNCYSFFYGWDLLGCCGHIKRDVYGEGFGCVWLLNTKAAEKYKLAYFKAIKRVLEKAKKDYDKGLYLWTKESYEKACKLNEVLGFKPIKKVDINGNNFIVYLLKGEDYGKKEQCTKL